MIAVPIDESESPGIIQTADLLMDVATMLMTSGAHTARVMRNVSRMAEAFGYKVEISIFQLSIIISVMNKDDLHQHTTLIRKIQPLFINYSIISKISILSWKTYDEKLSVDEVREEFDAIKRTKRYPRWLILLLVGCANAAFCRLFGGDAESMLMVGIGTVLGLYTRQELHHRGANHYISFIVAAFVASFIAGLTIRFNLGSTSQIALATSVLFLIPGVPLLNAVTDVIEGHVLTGTARGVNAIALILCISLGLLLTMLTFGLDRL
jgi:uncharacterized membrane protein YjjP (DUF1212 family)